MSDPRPVRLQLSRKKGFSLQALSLETNGLSAVNIARPSIWGNPYDWRVWIDDIPRDIFGSIAEAKMWCCERAVEAYLEDWRDGRMEFLRPRFRELRGRNLACWCDRPYPASACHGAFLIELANVPLCDGVT